MSGLRDACVLVTGAHGFIGAHVVRRLDAAGARVRCPRRPGTRPAPGLPGEHLELDLLDPQGLAAALDGVELVVHLAARSGGIEFQQGGHAEVFAANHALTAAVLTGAAAAGVRRVFLASSAVVYQGIEPLDEDAPVLTPGAASGYAWSKLTDEALGAWYARAGALDVVVGRFGNVYGPRGPASTVVHGLVRRAVSAPEGGRLLVWGDGAAVRSFLYVDDAARAVLTVLVGGAPSAVYNIDSSQPVSVAELARMVCECSGRGLEVVFDRSKPSGPPRRVPVAARLHRLGFTPSFTLGRGVGETLRAAMAATAPQR